MRKYLPLLTILTITTLACNAGGLLPTTTPPPLPTLSQPTQTPDILEPPPVESAFAPGNPTAMPTLFPTATPMQMPLPEEGLLILSPGPQSQVTSPLTVTGISNP